MDTVNNTVVDTVTPVVSSAPVAPVSTTNVQDLKNEIAKIANIENSPAWSISDVNADESLHLIHFNPESDPLRYGSIRGLVVDVKNKVVVAKSYSYTPTVQANELKLSNDQLVLTDVHGQVHNLKSGEFSIKKGCEGTIVRVFLHNGKVYHSSHRRLDVSRSRWGNSIPFLQMYRELNGPQPEDLFDLTKKFSPWVHLFIVVHPGVTNVTREDIGKGYLVYLGPKCMWTIDQSPFPVSEVDYDVRCPMKSHPSLDLNEANQILRGTNENAKDWRLKAGEFVMVYKTGSDDLIKIESPSFSWRLEQRDNDPNLFHRFFQLFNFARWTPQYQDQAWAEYCRRFVLLHPVDSHQLTLPVLNLEDAGANVTEALELMNTVEGRLFNIWMNLLLIVPLCKQAEVLSYYTSLLNHRDAVVNWVTELARNDNWMQMDLPERVKKIIQQARNFAEQKNAQNGKKTTKPSLMQLNKNVAFLVGREEGSSLYRMMKAMMDAKNK